MACYENDLARTLERRLRPERFGHHPGAKPGPEPVLEAVAAMAALVKVAGCMWDPHRFGFTVPTLAMLHLLCEVALVLGGGEVLSLGAGRGVFEALAEQFAERVLKRRVQVTATDDRFGPSAFNYNTCGELTTVEPRRFDRDAPASRAVARYGGARVLLIAWPPYVSESAGDSGDGALADIAQAVRAWARPLQGAGLPFAVVMVEEVECTGGPALEGALKECGLKRHGMYSPSIRAQVDSTCIRDFMNVYVTKEWKGLATRAIKRARFLPGDLSFRGELPLIARGSVTSEFRSRRPRDRAGDDLENALRRALWGAAEAALGAGAGPEAIRELAAEIDAAWEEDFRKMEREAEERCVAAEREFGYKSEEADGLREAVLAARYGRPNDEALTALAARLAAKAAPGGASAEARPAKAAPGGASAEARPAEEAPSAGGGAP